MSRPCEFIEELGDCDRLGDHLVIYNDRLAKVLERLKVAVRNVRGSYGLEQIARAASDDD